MHHNLSPTFANQLSVQILEIGRIEAGIEWRFDDIRSPFHRLYFVKGGDGSVQDRQTKTPLEAGKTYLVPANHAYSYACKQSINKEYVHFRVDLCAGLDVLDYARQQGQLQNCVIEVPSHFGRCDELSKALDCLLECPSDILANLQLRTCVTSSVVSMLEGQVLSLPILGFSKENPYPQVFSYIAKHVTHGIRVADIARVIGADPKNFARQFKRHTGISLKSHLLTQLNQKAQNALLTSNQSVANVAQDLGFDDEFYFSRYFKKMNGVAPSDYRQMIADMTRS